MDTHDGIFSNAVYDPKTRSWKYREPVPGWHMGNYYFQPDTDEKTWTNGWIGLDYVHSENNDRFRITVPDSRRGEIVRISIDKLRNTGFQRQGDGVEIVARPDGKIWWIGGRGKWVALGRGESLVLSYDPETDTWPQLKPGRTGFQTDIPEMNERRMDHEAVQTPDGKIYVFGGWRYEQDEDKPYVSYTRHAATDTVECYDPESNQWTYRSSMSSKRLGHAAACGPGGRIYVFGGAVGPNEAVADKLLDTTEMYDPKTDTWSEKTPLPEPIISHAAVLGADGRIYIVGGGGASPSNHPLRKVYIYDPSADSWSKGPSMNYPRSTLAAVATPDAKIYAIGGTDVEAYKGLETLNFFLPENVEFSTGRVQDTVEVLDISKSGTPAWLPRAGKGP
jgi:N-acetylneuraminic acid mutarotase